MSDKLKMLIVDDNEEFCRNVTDILELKGFEVMTALDGFEALELVKQDGFDLVLMDVKMPVMNGVETFKKIKEIAPYTPVIMVSAFAFEDLIREALRDGAFGYLKKPLDFEKLFELIGQAVPDGALVLVVDDDQNLCANIRDVLTDRDYRVSITSGGEQAIQLAREENFDIMLIDMKMPVLNGLETYLAIRSFRPEAVAIIITGYPQEMGELAQQALQKNAYTCLEKPINMDDLLSLLEQIREQKARGIIKKPE